MGGCSVLTREGPLKDWCRACAKKSKHDICRQCVDGGFFRESVQAEMGGETGAEKRAIESDLMVAPKRAKKLHS